MAFDYRRWITGGISDLPERELRKLYSQTLHNVRKRQARMAASEFAGTTLGEQAIAFKTYELKSLGSRTDIENELMRLQYFQAQKQTSAKGLRSVRSQTIRTLHSNGYKFINKGNLDKFGAFMEAWRKATGYSKASPTPEELKPFTEVFSKLSAEEIEARFEHWSGEPITWT